MVPIMYWIITAMGIPSTIAIRVAFGTSLLVILPTAISGTWMHNKKKVIYWRATLILGSCGLIGALVGSTLATHLNSEVLEKIFGGLLLAVALWMGLGTILALAGKEGKLKDGLLPLAVCGFPIGIITGLMGLGGGVFMVPALVLALNFPMHIAIGTSMATIIFTSLGGVIGYMVNGIGVPGLLPYSIGYVNLPIWLCLAATSIPLAQLGARGAHALPAKQLKYIFIAIVVYVGLRMLGVF